MKKEIKDYLHLYLGCQTNYGKLEGIRDCYAYTIVDGKDTVRGNVCDCKPILRPLNDMTEEEGEALVILICESIYGYGTYNFDKYISKLVEDDRVGFILKWTEFDDRIGLTVAVNDGVAFSVSGNTLNVKQFEVTKWLLAKRFDLFGLIEEDLAVDKSTIVSTSAE